jgi:D-arabinose 1-dehydrogenase-like Zn-dependent alcohol dehydrogenase
MLADSNIISASSASGYVAFQLAKLAKLRTICVVDVARHGERLLQAGADLLVDRYDTERAISIIRGVTKGKLRFGLDTVGRDTAEQLQKTLCTDNDDGRTSHLVGLANIPKTKTPGIMNHKVPIKVFHDISTIGDSLMTWLERLLLGEKLRGPETETAVGGLGGINEALDVLRTGAVSGKRLVVPLEKSAPHIA